MTLRTWKAFLHSYTSTGLCIELDAGACPITALLFIGLK